MVCFCNMQDCVACIHVQWKSLISNDIVIGQPVACHQHYAGHPAVIAGVSLTLQQMLLFMVASLL
jgi:hypothetical protein